MIGPGSGVRVFLAAGITDMRCGIAGLCARAKRALAEDPASGAVFVFRGRMGDRLKILHWDGQGFCLYYKVLERGHFPWPKATEGKVALTPAEMSMLWEGMDWRQPRWTSAPTRM
jgi:transposase